MCRHNIHIHVHAHTYTYCSLPTQVSQGQRETFKTFAGQAVSGENVPSTSPRSEGLHKTRRARQVLENPVVTKITCV